MLEYVEIEDPCELGDYILLGQDGPKKILRIGPRAIIRSHTVIYRGSSIGANFTTGHHVLIRNDSQIGDNVCIGTHSIIEHFVTIESDVRIHSNVFIPEYSTLKKGCWIGPCVCFTNARYPQSPNCKASLIGPTIEEGAIIGAHATLLPGVIIGKGAIVGAGAVVTKNVVAGSVVVGNPAIEINTKDKLPYEESYVHSTY